MTTLAPHVDGWRTEDGYRLTISRGAYSKRPISELTTPDGLRCVRAAGRKASAATLLEWAETDIGQHRRTGRVGR